MTLKKILFIPFLLCLAMLFLPTKAAYAQLGSIEGRVFVAQTAQPLLGCNIVIETRDGEFIAGLSSDGAGEFRVLNILQGRYVLVVTTVGYQEYRKKINIRDVPLNLTIRMIEEVFNIDGVEVTSSAIQDSSEVEVSVFRIAPQDVQLLAGGGGDVIRVLQTLPGVQTSSDFSNQLIVRGGSPDQNLIKLDDIEVFNPYRLSGMASMFNPSVVSAVELITGGFEASYGDRLSSVLVVTTRDITDDAYLSGEIDISMNVGSLLLEGKTPFWNGGWMVTARKTYYNKFAASFAENTGIYNDISFPNFWDIQGKIVLHPASGHTLRLQTLFSQDELDWLSQQDVGEQGTKKERDRLNGENFTENNIIGGTWLYSPNSSFSIKMFGNWYQTGGRSDFSGSFFPSQETPPGPPDLGGGSTGPIFGVPDEDVLFVYDQSFAFDKYSMGLESTISLGNHQVEFGGGATLLKNNLQLDLEINEFGRLLLDALKAAPNWVGVIADSVDFQKDFKRYSGFLQDKVNLFDGKVFIQPGLRYDYYEISDAGYLSARFNSSFSVLPGLTFRAAWGQYLQSPGFEKLLDEGEVFDLARYENLSGLKPERSTHYVAGLSAQVTPVFGFKLEGYYKSLSDLVVQNSANAVQLTPVFAGGARIEAQNWQIVEEEGFVILPEPINGADGQSYGAELLLEKRFKDNADEFSGWVSYTYALSEREQTFADSLYTIPYEYDRRHQLNVVFNYRFGAYNRWNAGLTVRYGSGLPYTPAVGFKPLIGQVVDPDDPSIITNVILTDPTTTFVRFVPDFGGQDNINSDRLPAYSRADFRLTYAGAWLGMDMKVYLDVINIFAVRNVLYYKYVIDAESTGIGVQVKPGLFKEPVYMFPFVPSFGFNVKF